MQTMINWSKSPVVVVDDAGERITIQPGQEKPVSGDFSQHPWVKKNRLEITSGENTGEAAPDDPELNMLRAQYKGIFGKKAHNNAGKEKLRKEIDKWRNQQD